MYDDIYQKFVGARKDGDRETARIAIKFFVDSIKSALNQPLSVGTFSKFIEDKNFLFSTNTDYFHSEVVEANLQTNGLLAQIFEIYGIIDHDNLSENIKDSIFDLHSNLSRGIMGDKDKINKILKILDLIRLAIN